MIASTLIDNAPWSKTWSAAIREPATEFEPTELEVIEGEIPADLQGRLFQNGPGRLERGGQRVGHWFDGDGAILGVKFEAGRAHATYRYVQTAGYQAEEKAARYLSKSYGMLAPGAWPLRMLAPFKNAANTAVLPLSDRLLALWEGGLPHALDLETLDTLGLDTLSGSLKPHQSYSAHPKIDPTTGEIFNFAVQPGPMTQLCLYRSDASGKVQQQSQLPLRGVPLIHDMVLAGPYVLICIPPVRMQLVPALMNLKSFSESLAWRPELGTEVLIFDRQTLNLLSRSTAEPWFQWHYANGHVNEAGEIVVDVVRYEDFSVHEQLRTVAAGYVDGILGGQLWRMAIDPHTAALISQRLLYEGTCEFPAVPPRQVGQKTEAIYFVTHTGFVNHTGNKTIAESGQFSAGHSSGAEGTALRDNCGELVGAIAQLNPETQAINILDCGHHYYPFSPIYAGRESRSLGPDSNTKTEQGWILSLIYNGSSHQSELWILDSETWETPRCKLKLPVVIPFGFHGSWIDFARSSP